MDSIDRSLLKSSGSNWEPNGSDIFGGAGLSRSKPILRKSGSDLFGSTEKLDADDAKHRSFLKKTATEETPIVRSRPQSPASLEIPNRQLDKEPRFVSVAPDLVRKNSLVRRSNDNIPDSTDEVQGRDINRDSSSIKNSESDRDKSLKTVRYSNNNDVRSYSTSPDQSPRRSDILQDNASGEFSKPSRSDSDHEEHQRSKPPSREITSKTRPKSSTLWEKIKRREQREQHIRERGFFEHNPPDFVDMSHEPDYCGERDENGPGEIPKRKTLFYSKRGGDSAYIDVVAEVQNDAYVNVESYDDDPGATLSMKYGRAVRMASAKPSTHYASDDSSVMYSTVVFDEWVTRKAALVRAEQKRREALKHEEARMREEEFKNKLMASKAAFLQWKKEKDHVLEKKKAQEAEQKAKELEKLVKQKEISHKTKQYIKAWVNERPKTAVDAEKAAIEKRRKAREEKLAREEEEKKKKELCESAFKKWQEEKLERAKKEHIEMQKQLKAMKTAEFTQKLERDQQAVESYEQWLQRKEKETLQSTRIQRASSATIGGSMGRLSSRNDFIEERPPWFPASRTIPRPSARLT